MTKGKNTESFRPLRSLTRLLVGAVLWGSELLDDQLRSWEDQPVVEDSLVVVEGAQPDLQFDPLPETLPPPNVGLPPLKNKVKLRHALIGLIFEGEENLEKGFSAAKQVGNFALKITNPIFRPIQKLGIINPTQKSVNHLVDRGQSEIDRWVERGREEEIYSRELAQQATTSTVDQSINYMAQNPALEELIQQQSVSLANQILAQVRAISVSGDYFFEGLVRYILRRKPRYLLPPPSSAVQEQATWKIQDIRHEEL